MAENFDLIFGQNASQQYAWNDTDYQNGWETIGNIPPTAAQFDALQRRADMKSQELNSRLITVEASIAGGAGQKREADTTYAVGDVVSYDGLPMDWVLVCIVGGTSGSADITLPSPRVEGARILDGTVTWALRKIATYGGIGYRQSSTACPAGTIAFSTALPAGWYLEATTGGTTSASDLVITSPSVGDTVTDGTVVWTIRKMGSGNGSNMTYHKDVITTSGTYTVPATGLYKITVKGGGGGGGYGSAGGSVGGYCGGGGGEGGTTITYAKLTANESVSVIIGAGGAGATANAVTASSGGDSSVTINGDTFVGGGGGGGANHDSTATVGNISAGIGGTGTIPGAPGSGESQTSGLTVSGGSGGGAGGGISKVGIPDAAIQGGGGAGATGLNGKGSFAGGAGGDGYVWFEYYTPGSN